MHTTKFYWMLDHVDPAPDRPRRPMRERCVVVRNRHGYTITTRHYTDGDVGLRYADARHVCDCGRPGAHVVAITQLTAEDRESNQTLRLCDACYAEFVAMEAAYA